MIQKIKKPLNAALALLVASSMAIGLSGCSDTSWGAECGGEKMPAGVYISNVLSAYSDGLSQLPDDADTDNVWKNTLDGVNFQVWVQNQTQENVRGYFAVEQKFDEMGLTMDELTKAQADYVAEYQWAYYQSVYEKNGISKDSYVTSVYNSYKTSLLFDAIYGEGGTEEVPQQELLDKFNAEYASIDRIFIPLTAGDDGSISQETKDEALKKAEGYKERMEKGETIGALAKEYSNEKAVAAGQEPSDDEVSTASIISYENSGYSDVFTDAIKSAEKGKPIVIEDDANICLVVVNEVTLESEVFQANQSYLLSDMKGEEFEGRLIQWGKELDVTFNEAAVSRYDIKKLKI